MTIANGSVANADDVTGSIGRTTSQLAYEQVKSDATEWTNTDYLGADVFTDSNGAKNTIDTSSSTSFYETDNVRYIIPIVDDAGSDSTSDPDSFTNPTYAFDGNDGTAATKTSADAEGLTFTIGKTFASKLVTAVKGRVGWNSSSGGRNVVIKIQTYNGSTWDDKVTVLSGTLDISNSISFFEVIDTTCEGVRIEFYQSNGGNNVFSCYTIEYGDYNTSSTVETNTIINEVIPDSIVVYGKTDLPTDTSITVDVSEDGGSTFGLTGKSLNTAIDTSSFTTGDLALKFNLATTDTSETPKLYGYGVAITDL